MEGFDDGVTMGAAVEPLVCLFRRRLRDFLSSGQVADMSMDVDSLSRCVIRVTPAFGWNESINRPPAHGSSSSSPAFGFLVLGSCLTGLDRAPRAAS